MRRLITPLIIAPILFGATPGFAQSNPSADQIINSLKPTGNLLNGSTRGIRLAAPSGENATGAAWGPAPAAPSEGAPSTGAPGVRTAAAKPMAEPAASVSDPSVNLTVDFATGSAQLTPQAMATLDALGRALSSSELASYRFRIEGHTDTVGSADANRALSDQRAEAVAAYLTSKFGVAPGRLRAVGMGEQGLLVPTPPQTPEPRNRRVQVINLGA